MYYRVLLFILLSISNLSALALPATAVQTEQDSTPTIVLFIRLNNEVINPVTAEYIISSIDHAEQIKALCLVLQLDTPGGLLESTRDVVKRILNSRVPIVVYVYPSGARAASAGVFITLASHIAAMAPSTNIGAAHPVSISSTPEPPSPHKPTKDTSPEKQEPEKTPDKEEPKPSDIMSEKIVNDAAAWIRAIAEYRRRNATWAEESVRKSLSLTETEALRLNVIDLIAESEEALVAQINGREVQVLDKKIKLNTSKAVLQHLPMSKRQRLLSILANPNIAYLLLILGFYGLLFEITHPGGIFPGVAGAICLILAAYALQMLPINYAGLILILIGLLLFVAEVKVTSYGLLTIGGLICLLLGSIMLIRAPQPFTGVSFAVILPVLLATLIIMLFLLWLVIKSHHRQVTTGKEGMIGEIGHVVVPLTPAGKIFVHGEIWEAFADESIPKDTQVQVIDVSGLKLKVKAVSTVNREKTVNPGTEIGQG